MVGVGVGPCAATASRAPESAPAAGRRAASARLRSGDSQDVLPGRWFSARIRLFAGGGGSALALAIAGWAQVAPGGAASGATRRAISTSAQGIASRRQSRTARGLARRASAAGRARQQRGDRGPGGGCSKLPCKLSIVALLEWVDRGFRE